VRPASSLSPKLPRCFNPRTRTGCDHGRFCGCICRTRFQSTHPHGVRQEDDFDVDQALGVSIHAPARGATSSHLKSFASMSVSIHAPARGATTHTFCYLFGLISFNPRTRTGCDYYIIE